MPGSGSVGLYFQARQHRSAFVLDARLVVPIGLHKTAGVRDMKDSTVLSLDRERKSDDTVPMLDRSEKTAPEDRRIGVLLVDDEPRNLSVLESILDDPSYRLVRAESGDAALLQLISG